MELYEKGDFLSPGKVNKLGYTARLLHTTYLSSKNLFWTTTQLKNLHFGLYGQTLAHNLSTIKKYEQVSAISMKLTLSCVVGSKKNANSQTLAHNLSTIQNFLNHQSTTEFAFWGVQADQMIPLK